MGQGNRSAGNYEINLSQLPVELSSSKVLKKLTQVYHYSSRGNFT